MVPEPGMTCLGMEYFCFEGDGLWASSDEELIGSRSRAASARACRERRDVIDGSVVRMPKAYPIYDSTYREHLDVAAQLHRSDLRTCTPSAGTGCTSTTTRTTRC